MTLKGRHPQCFFRRELANRRQEPVLENLVDPPADDDSLGLNKLMRLAMRYRAQAGSAALVPAAVLLARTTGPQPFGPSLCRHDDTCPRITSYDCIIPLLMLPGRANRESDDVR